MTRPGSLAERRRALQADIARTRTQLALQGRKLRDEAGLALVIAAATRLLSRRFRWAALVVPVAVAVIGAWRARQKD